VSSLNIPYSFTNGTVADATQVNANFNAVKSFVEGSVVQTDGSTVNAAGSITNTMLAGNIAASKLASYPKLVVPHTFVVGGPVNVQSGQIDYVNPFFVKVPSTQTVKLISARHRINSGTSATVKLQNNGSDITGFTSISVTSTAADTDPADVTLANNDLISLVVTATSGSPQNMSVTLFFEYTWVG
jgi:hypothetical protein